MGKHAIDLNGRKFDRLSIIRIADKKPRTMKGAYWLCKCTCGQTLDVNYQHLVAHNVKSCGCLRKELARTKRKSKGMTDATNKNRVSNSV